MYCRSLHFKNYFQEYDYDTHSFHSITTHFIPKIMMNKVKTTCNTQNGQINTQKINTNKTNF